MPRRFTEQEEHRIICDLRQAARDIMGRRGVRKTAIDELAGAAGISKGSFYRFYDSKESLALEVLAEWERSFHDGITRRFSREKPYGLQECARQLTAVFLEDFPQQLMLSGLQGLFDPQEIAWLIQRAGQEEVQRMEEQDIRLLGRLKPLLAAGGLQPVQGDQVIVAGLRMLFEGGSGSLRQPSPQYSTAFGLLVKGFLMQMFRLSGKEGMDE